MHTLFMSFWLLLPWLSLSAQTTEALPAEDIVTEYPASEADQKPVDRIAIDTEIAHSDSAKLYTADIVIANYQDQDFYPYIKRKIGMSSDKITSLIAKQSQTQLPVVFYTDWPALMPNNHLSDVKQFTLSLSSDNESGNWGLFSKKYDVQIDAYFSQQMGLQTVHCFIASGENANCNAYLEQGSNHMNIVIELR